MPAAHLDLKHHIVATIRKSNCSQRIEYACNKPSLSCLYRAARSCDLSMAYTMLLIWWAASNKNQHLPTLMRCNCDYVNVQACAQLMPNKQNLHISDSTSSLCATKCANEVAHEKKKKKFTCFCQPTRLATTQTTQSAIKSITAYQRCPQLW